MLPLLGSLNFYQLLRQDVDRQKAAIAESRRRAAKRGREHATGGIHDGPLACGGCRRTFEFGNDCPWCDRPLASAAFAHLSERDEGPTVSDEVDRLLAVVLALAGGIAWYVAVALPLTRIVGMADIGARLLGSGPRVSSIGGLACAAAWLGPPSLLFLIRGRKPPRRY